MIKSFFVERTSRQNQSRYFLPFQTKKKFLKAQIFFLVQKYLFYQNQ